MEVTVYEFFLRWFFLLLATVASPDEISWDCPYQDNGSWYVCEYRESGWRTYIRWVERLDGTEIKELRLVSPVDSTMAVAAVSQDWVTVDIWAAGQWFFIEYEIGVKPP